MHDRLLEGQRSFGIESWRKFAVEAGVPDLVAFDVCNAKKDPVPRIERNRALAKKLGIRGTPTLIVNGWKLSSPPTSAQLDDMVKAVISGKNPMFTYIQPRTAGLSLSKIFD
jgi:hypothetical protein